MGEGGRCWISPLKELVLYTVVPNTACLHGRWLNGPVGCPLFVRPPAILDAHAHYPSETVGAAAVADALYGRFSPAGKLPYTVMPRAFEDISNFASMDMTAAPGRTCTPPCHARIRVFTHARNRLCLVTVIDRSRLFLFFYFL